MNSTFLAIHIFCLDVNFMEMNFRFFLHSNCIFYTLTLTLAKGSQLESWVLNNVVLSPKTHAWWWHRPFWEELNVLVGQTGHYLKAGLGQSVQSVLPAAHVLHQRSVRVQKLPLCAIVKYFNIFLLFGYLLGSLHTVVHDIKQDMTHTW